MKSVSPTIIKMPDFGWQMESEPILPGQMLQEEFLTPLAMTQSALAKKLDCDVKTINKICNGHTAITAKTALGFSAVFGTTAEFWLNLQNTYDLWRERNRAEKSA